MAVPTGYNQRVFELSSRVSQLQQQLHFGRTLQAEQLQSRLEGLAARLVAVRCSFHSEFCLLAEEWEARHRGGESEARLLQAFDERSQLLRNTLG
eukprot:g11934.t1